SRKETRLIDSPAAIAVVTEDDIRRSGHSSLPELLRLVPGMHVARIHGNEWAVTARGFNDQYANKLLVLVDGRSIYTPMFAGVYWNAQDSVLEDLDRIEVIRGPGATLWGANAVNGVINLTTKSAKETQGGLVVVEAGTEERPAVSFRQGGQLAPDIYYRAYVKYFDRDGFVEEPGQDGADSWDALRLGGRVDWEPAEGDRLMLQAEYYRGSVGEHFEGTSLAPPFQTEQNLIHRNFGGHVLARWTRPFSDRAELTVQAYYDRFHHWDGDTPETRDTYDLDVQHRFPAGTRHDIVWGFGYRHTADRLAPSFYLSFDPERERQEFASAFVQDEITLKPDRLTMTLGAKLEHNESTGTEFQPSARFLWSPTERQALWAAVSRAVRIPSRYDRHARLNAAVFQPPGSPPLVVALLSRPEAQEERLTAYEAGYRIEPHANLSFDVAAFYNDYEDILGYVSAPTVFESTPAPPHVLIPLIFENVLGGRTYGVETSVQWRPARNWKLVASHSWLRMHIRPDPSKEVESPRHQWQVRSHLDLPKETQLIAALYYIDGISPSLDNDRVQLPSYLRLDLGLSCQPTEALTVGIWGQNLLDPRHPEFGSFKTNTLTEVPRSFVARATWRF
ncbi:MAG TPA: TonB-dependent receptor, partial [Opitutaceae bacterium]|nr:TonB-dependent receptor [Opitutaceae bacterium]